MSSFRTFTGWIAKEIHLQDFWFNGKGLKSAFTHSPEKHVGY